MTWARIIFGAILILAAIAPGCRDEVRSVPPGTSASPAVSTAPSVPPSVPGPERDTAGEKKPRGGHILEIEGERSLTPDDLRAILSREDLRHNAAFRGGKVARDQAVEEFLVRKLVLLDAKATGFDRSEPLATQLETARMAWISNLYKQNVIDNLSIPDRDVAGRLPRNWEMRTFGEITLETPEEAEKIRRRVAAGEDFESLAREHSISPSAPKGGNLRPVDSLSRTVLPEIIDKELWDMPVGGCTPVFPSPLGWGHAFACVRKIEQIPAADREEYAREMRHRIRGERSREILEGLDRTFRKEVDEEAIRKFDSLSPDAVLGKVNGKPVTRRYFEAYFQARPKLTPPTTAEARKSNLEGILSELGYFQIAEGTGIDRIPEFRKSYAEYRAGEVNQAYYARMYAPMKVTDAQAKAFYEENRETIRQQAGVVARVIVMEGEKEAWDLHGRLDRKEIGFEEAVKKHSADAKSKKAEGKIGFLPADGRSVPAAYKAALEVKEGAISPPIDFKGKYYIFRVDERKTDRVLTFDESKAQIRRYLLDKAKKDAYDADVKRLKAKYRYRIDEELLATVAPQDTAHGKPPPAKMHR
ncbi:MAG: peptidyl-prolyl cis-trans isomerase [Deltaproteobacteria bacterium]|nr:peptidyl-prolyl cis-trans isomerase [Deltaproteobacteria bacterium]